MKHTIFAFIILSIFFNIAFASDIKEKRKLAIISYNDKNFFEAEKLLLPLAESGDGISQKYLFSLYINGYLGEKNLNKISTWGKRASDSLLKEAKSGIIASQLELGRLYERYSEHFGVDTSESNKWLKTYYSNATLSYKNLDITELWSVARRHQFGFDGIEVNTSIANTLNSYAIEKCKNESRLGDGEASYICGFLYSSGHGVPSSKNIALQYFELGARQGNSNSAWTAGKWYMNGDYVNKDYKKANDFFTICAIQGNYECKVLLGENIAAGRAIAVTEEADRWFSSAAAQNPTADYYAYVDSLRKGGQLELALKYSYLAIENGKEYEFLAADISRLLGKYRDAYKLYSIAASRGEERALYWLGVFHFDGVTVPRNISKAMSFLTKAAEKESRDANFFLGIIYEQGDGVKMDKKAALAFYEKASHNHRESTYYRQQYLRLKASMEN